jgi:hypothetical protein
MTGRERNLPAFLVCEEATGISQTLRDDLHDDLVAGADMKYIAIRTST